VVDEHAARDAIAFIRRAIAEGRGYAGTPSPDMLVWGLAIAAGYLASYATVRGWWRLPQGWIWTLHRPLVDLFAARHVGRRVRPERPRPATVEAMRMLWLGCGICLTSLAIGLVATGEIDRGWFRAVTAGILGVAFFGGSYLCDLVWMRWVAVGWWLGQIALLALQRRPELLPTSAALTLALLALPGAAVLRRRTTDA
jgi:hypothetical protein